MAVNITGTRSRTLTTDNDNDGQADSGDIFTYEVIVTNSGTDAALDVQLDADENGYTIGNVQIGPIGVDNDLNDIYGTVAGNTPLTFNAADLTGNDLDPDDGTPSLTITHVNGQTFGNGAVVDIIDPANPPTVAGTLTNNGDGTFTFRPEAGFEGDVSFTYDTVDSDGIASVAATPATVNITVGDAVWYVNSNVGSDATGDGTFENPFASLNPLTTGGSSDTLDDSGDTIFVYATGANQYNSGIVLESGQILRGEGVAADYVVNGLTISSVQTDTQIEYTTFGVELNQNNTIIGIDLLGENANAVAIRDNGGTVGNLAISDVEIDGIGQIIDVDNGGALNVTFQSLASHGSLGAGGLIDLAGVTGNFTVTGFTTIDTSMGSHTQVGIDIGGAGTNLVANFAGGTSMNMGPNAAAGGINLSDNSGSTTFAGLAVSTNFAGNTSAGFVANNAGTLTVTGAGNSVVTLTGQILSITNTLIGANDVNFNVLSATGKVTGNAVTLNNVDNNDVNISNLTLNNGATGDGINVGNASSTNVNINTANINATDGDGIELSGSSGSFSIVTGNIGNTNDPGGDTVRIIGGTGAVDIDANLFKSSAGDIVEINSHTTGTVSFGGNLTANGGGNTGIRLDGNVGTIEFTGASKVINTGASNGVTILNNVANVSFVNGGLDIDTTSGFGIAAGTSATGTGGTLTISGSNNTLASTTGHAILMNGTDIGAGGITLLSVNSNGGNFAGIWLKDTGTAAAGFTVTGTGSTAGSGGTIASKGGADNDLDEGIGIYLENVSNVSLSNISMTGVFSNFGIRGSGVNNFTLRDSSLTGTFGTSIGLQEDAIRFGTQSSASNGLTGTALFEGNTIQGGVWDNLAIFNNAASALNLTIQDSANDAAVFEDNGITGNDGVLVEVSGAGASATINVTGVAFGGARGDHFQSNTLGSASSTVTLANNTFLNNHPDITSGGGGIAISGGELALASNYTINYNITGNTFRGSEGAEIFVSMVGKSGVVNGVILNNIIGTDNASNPQSDGTGTLSGGNGDAIFIKQEKFNGAGNLNHAVRIEGNQIRDFDASGIRIWSNNQGGGVGRVEATIKNNIIEEVNQFSFGGINALVGGTGAGDIGLLGLAITGNTINLNNSSGADGDNNAIIVDQVGPNAVVYVPGVGGPEPNRGEARPPAGGTASAELSTLWGATNTLVNGEFPNHIGGGVDATLVFQLRNDPFVLAVPIMGAPTPGADWEAAAAQARDAYLASLQVDDDAGTGGGDQGYGGAVQDTGKGGSHPQPQPQPDPEPTHPVIVDDNVLSQAELDYLVEAAIQRWADAGASAEQLAAMRAAAFDVADMNGNFLATSNAGIVRIDSDGAGHGWFLDRTPGDNGEYDASGNATAGGGAAGKMDLLTVIMHELGHQVGLDDLYQPADSGELMYGYASLGTRRNPDGDDLDGADMSHAGHTSYVVLTPTIGTLPADSAVRVIYTATVDTFQSEVVPTPFSNNVTVEGSNFADVPLGADALAIDTLSIGDLVFIDVNKNGVYDSGTDDEVDGVAVSLYADDNDDGTPDGAAIATDTTDAFGLYRFDNLAPGTYIVALDASNFGVGGALEGRTSVAGGNDPDTDTDDDDDNGVAGTGGLAGAIVSAPVTLVDDGEAADDGTGDLDYDNTVDFGFIQPNQEPESTGLDGDSVTWTEGDGAVLMDSGSDAAISDSDSTDFDGGSLTVAISAGYVSGEDVLGITTGAVTLSTGVAVGSEVTVNGSPIGTISAVSDDSIAIDFNGNATPARVSILVQSFDFVNNGGDAPTDGDRTISWTLVDGDGVVDGGDDTAVFTSTVDVDPVNDAPVLADAVVALADQSEDDPAPVGAVGSLVSSLVDLDSVGGGLDNVTDPDSADIGIALTGTDTTNGSWFYSIDGGANWVAVGAVTDASALLLAGDDRLYFQPNAGFDGTIASAITFRAWDQSSGSAGTTGNDTTTNGGSTPYSTATDTASLTVDPDVDAVDDAFATNEDTAITTGNVLDDNGSGADIGTTVTAVNTVAGDVGNLIVLPSGAELTLNSDGTFIYDPNDAFDFTPTAGSGASNTPSTDSFTYELDNGDTATVTITITGLDSDDNLQGTAGDDVMSGGIRDDELFGLDGNDQLNGNAGRDHLDGGTGDDAMTGGAGHDTYVVDSLLDTTVELANQGRDHVLASLTWTLADHVDDLTLTSANADNGTGNDLGNAINGNNQVNTLTGLDGNDTLKGHGGADVLIGGLGNDRIFGGAGIDDMQGGVGNDVYNVDHASDVITELAGEGNERVESSVSYTISANIEDLTLLGAGAINGTGNDDANILTGNGNANTLSGGGANDIIYGAGGGDALFGGDGDDVLKGQDGDDSLHGDAGRDQLFGGDGADGFYFEAMGSATRDKIRDFDATDDTIFLDTSVFTQIALGTLAANAFVNGTSAGDADDRIIYDSVSGNLWYDEDGTGAAPQVIFAVVEPAVALTNLDFVGF